MSDKKTPRYYPTHAREKIQRGLLDALFDADPKLEEHLYIDFNAEGSFVEKLTAAIDELPDELIKSYPSRDWLLKFIKKLEFRCSGEFNDSKEKLIFLDIDGVLNSAGRMREHMVVGPDGKGMGYVCLDLVARLSEIIRRTGAKVVISSTWRTDGLEAFQHMWKTMDIAGEVVGITPMSSNTIEGVEQNHPINGWRGLEIRDWLKHSEYDIFFDNYIILDDDSDMLYDQRNNFIHVDASVGITDGVVYRAVKRLGEIIQDE